MTKVDPLAPWQPTVEQPWDVRRVIHLHRRAGWGANWKEIQRDLEAGPQAAIDQLLDPVEDRSTQEFEELSEVIGSAAVAANNIARLQAWWLLRMLRSPDPLGEKLTLMWHNHFATSYQKVQDVGRMQTQNEILRCYARASFHELLPAVIKDPAMLVWLDADANRKEHPNENLAREIMELFTLGVDSFHADSGNATSINGYSEQDVQQAARALTGWTASANGFRFNARTHDTGEKIIFGKRGNWNGDQLLKLLLQHPATPRRLAWRICHEFMGEGCVTEELIAALAEILTAGHGEDELQAEKSVGSSRGIKGHRKAGFQRREDGYQGLDVARAVAVLLRSQAFFEDSNIGSRVASPIEFMLGALRALEMLQPPPSSLLLAEWSARMGQALFAPPNVFGWRGGRAWLTTRTIISRANFVESLFSGQLHNPARPLDMARLAKRYSFGAREKQVSFYAQLLLGDDFKVEHFKGQSLNDCVAKLLLAPRAQLW